MKDPSIVDAALAYVRAGVSIIPIDHRDKRPAAWLLPRGADGKPTWKPYQVNIAPEDEVRSWFTGPRPAQAVAVVGGAVSGGAPELGLLIIDFDVPGFYERWGEVVGELADGLPVQRTGGGGHQVFLRCPEPGGNDKLAWEPDEAEETGRTIAIETRGEGGYAVVPPSLHPSGNRYEWLGPVNVVDAPTVSQARADALLAAARKLDRAPMTRQQCEAAEAQARQAHRQRRAGDNGQGSVIHEFNRRHALEALLEAHGYTKGPRGRFIRPGGRSESVSVLDGRSCHWSSDDPLNDGKGKGGCGCHDAFDLFAVIQHGGDVRAAVRAAAEVMGMKATAASAAGQAKPAAGEAAGGAPTPVLVCMADVEAREVAWLWPGRVPLGRITLLVGRPGEGKSFLTTDMAARVTTGAPWPDRSECPAGSVILVSAEDDPGDTIRPRLDAHRADCRRVHLLPAVRWFDGRAEPHERMFTLADLPALEAALAATPDCRLIVVDPIGSFLGGGTDAHRDNEVRAVLAPVAKLAERYGPAVLVVAHRRKGAGSSADDLALGSRAFTGIARAVWHLSRDPHDKARRLLLPGKNNLAPEGTGLAFAIMGDPPAVAWEPGPVAMSADDALAAENGEGDGTRDAGGEDEGGEGRPGPRPAKKNAAADWLRELLAGGPMSVGKRGEAGTIAEAAHAAGLSWGTVRRAREALGIKPHKGSMGEGWSWALPDGEQSTVNLLRQAERRAAAGGPAGDGAQGAQGGGQGAQDAGQGEGTCAPSGEPAQLRAFDPGIGAAGARGEASDRDAAHLRDAGSGDNDLRDDGAEGAQDAGGDRERWEL